jgi:hypothetical protein
MDRRLFLQSVLVAGCATPGAGLAVRFEPPPGWIKNPKHLIVLWMSGGPSHMDLWDIKVGSPNQGAFKPIETAVRGIRIGELMENTAKEFKNLSIIRTLDSREGDEGRATFRMNHVFPPSDVGMQIPGVGAIVSHFLGSRKANALPPCVTIEGHTGFGDPGFLGNRAAGISINGPGSLPEDISVPNMGDPNTTRARGGRRRDLLNLLDGNYVAEHESGGPKNVRNAAQDLRDLHNRALDISLKTSLQVFQFDNKDNTKLEKRFGQSGFGRGCLLAAKLAQAGVAAVQVTLGGWKMHGAIGQAIVGAAKVLDRGFAGLMAELRETGLIADTVVLWAGPFGRTPKISAQGDRAGPWSKCWSVVLGGCGIGGVEYGKTNEDGTEVAENPVSIERLYATIYTALGIDLRHRNVDLRDNLGHRFCIAGEKENAQPIKELLKTA